MGVLQIYVCSGRLRKSCSPEIDEVILDLTIIVGQQYKAIKCALSGDSSAVRLRLK
jgi:hypothetical protein